MKTLLTLAILAAIWVYVSPALAIVAAFLWLCAQ